MIQHHSSDFEQLCQYGTLLTFPKGHVFYDVYENQTYVYCLAEGLCALTSLKDCGKEHIYYYLKPPNIIGCIPAFINASHHTDISDESFFLLVAKSSCTVYRLTQETFFEVIQKHPHLINVVLSNVVNTSRDLLKHSYLITEATASSKIASTLLSLSELKGSHYILHKSFSYIELSKYLGIHHITVARIIAHFKDEGIIAKHGRSIILTDLENLKLYAQNIKTVQY
ncbi:MAG: Crp/Fnr family transcriptional regulator [Cellulosilyticaceae bacterium]